MDLIQPNQLEACRQAMTMGMVQVGLDKDFKKIEKESKEKAYELLGKEAGFIAVTAVELGVDHKVVFSFKAKPFADSITLVAGFKQDSIGFRWVFD